MTRITISTIAATGPIAFPAKQRRVYVEGNLTETRCEPIIQRYKEKFPQRKVVRWVKDIIDRSDMEPGAIVVQP